jgi:hypothetical protein
MAVRELPRKSSDQGDSGPAGRAGVGKAKMTIHYGSPRTHQPLGLAPAAATELLDWSDLTNVVRAQDETVTSSTPEAVAGYIFTRAWTDARSRRARRLIPSRRRTAPSTR